METRSALLAHAAPHLCSAPFTAHCADLDSGRTVLSILAGAHSVGEGILGFFDTREARAIRLVCVEFRDAVAAVPWADMRTRICGNVGGWRASFPRAEKANISVEYDGSDRLRRMVSRPRHNTIANADFVHFEGIHTLNMSHCSQVGITNSAFVHLKGIHTLDMSCCDQAGITVATFVLLEGANVVR